MPQASTQEIGSLLKDCTVKLTCTSAVGKRTGTGFFVAPGLLLTCGHVVKGVVANGVHAEWRQEVFTATIKSTDPTGPDLALVSFDSLSDHPCCVLEDGYPNIHDEQLLTFGYTENYPLGDSGSYECEGTSNDRLDGPLLKLKAGQAFPGMSGSPLVSLTTGRVCGVMATERLNAPTGGARAVPIATAYRLWPDLKVQQQNRSAHMEPWLQVFRGALRNYQSFNWQALAASLIAERMRLSSNALTASVLSASQGPSFGVEDIFVPLGLAKRTKNQDKGKNDGGAADGRTNSSAEAPRAALDRLELDEFFTGVLGESTKPGKPLRMALIGEPGAGKTTLLQRIASWILETSSDVPIWVQMAETKQEPVADWILTRWLPAAIGDPQPDSNLIRSLVDQVKAGRIWLLLDGVDELATTGAIALQTVADGLNSWAAPARVILTCRMNVWDAGQNALGAFEVFRTLRFSYGDGARTDQVAQFVKKWFSAEPAAGDRLRTALDEPGRERIKDLVTNPLQLTLLCIVWRLQQELPSSRFTLYQQFVSAFHKWKENRFPTTIAERRHIEQGLGELAVRSLSRDDAHRFFDEGAMCAAFEGALGPTGVATLETAIGMGWLIRVGPSREDPFAGMYAFVHPSFQEFFAAQRVDTWKYFINPGPMITPGAADGYRLLAPHWREPVLLWFGRKDVASPEKAAFLNAINNFDDGCDGLYNLRAVLLAAASTAEFNDDHLCQRLIVRVAGWAFGYSPADPKKWRQSFDALAKAASVALRQADRDQAIGVCFALLDVIAESWNRYAFFNVLEVLQTIAVGDSAAIETIGESLHANSNAQIRDRLLHCMTIVGRGNDEAIRHVIDLESKVTGGFRYSLIRALGELAAGNALAVDRLLAIAREVTDSSAAAASLMALGAAAPFDPAIIGYLISQLDIETEDRTGPALAALSHATGNSAVRDAVTRFASRAMDRLFAPESAAIPIYKRMRHFVGALGVLQQIGGANEFIKNATFNFLRWFPQQASMPDGSLLEYRERRDVYLLLPRVARNDANAEPALEELLAKAENDFERLAASTALTQLNRANARAREALIELLKSTGSAEARSKETPFMAAIALAENAPGDASAIEVLTKILKHSDMQTRRAAIYNLGYVGKGSRTVADLLIDAIPSSTSMTRGAIFEALARIGVADDCVYSALLSELAKNRDWLRVSDALRSIARLGAAPSYVVDVLLTFAQQTNYESVRSDAINALGTVAPGNQIVAVWLTKELLNSTQGSKTIAESLIRVLRPGVFAPVITLLRGAFMAHGPGKNDDYREACFSVLCHGVDNLQYSEFHRAYACTSP